MSFARYGYDDDRESYGDEEKPLREDGFYMHQCKCPCGHIFEVKWHKDITDWGVRETCPHCGNIYDEDDLAFEETINRVEQVLLEMGDELREMYPKEQQPKQGPIIIPGGISSDDLIRAALSGQVDMMREYTRKGE